MVRSRGKKMMMFEEVENDDVEDDDVEEEDRSQDRAVDMHLDISQEQLCARIYRKNPRSRCRLCVSCRVDMHLDVSQEPFYAKFTGKMPQTKGAMQTLCEPPTAEVEMHVDIFHKSHFV